MKIQVNKDVFTALNDVIGVYGEDKVMDLHSANTPEVQWKSEWAVLNDISIPDMAKCLYVGYDLKASPEEAIKDYYDIYLGFSKSTDHDVYPEGNHKIEAIEFVLNELDIKIKGINE